MAKLKKEEVAALTAALEEAYPDAQCALDFRDHFQLLCAVMLSAQTTDKSVNKATPALFEAYPDAAAIAAAPIEELERLLKPVGMYKTKSKNLQAMSAILAERYGGVVPQDYDALVALPGVGRKTANVVLSVGFGEPRIAVDTHVFRVANRMGLVQEKDVLQTELSLMKRLPKEKWSAMHHALIWHGRQVCDARKPKCEGCCAAPWCRKNGVK